ncbi:hypothetical protein FB45DRAFT_904599 [Roridomyces roridus]|uniref:Uncharacterized protein n=1 Tax=Roridomyces roridus TaxID=1738132 RepID=A0AAD7C5A7_9AGAR|nr:hypothetical protein FB45DRAFT_904599 [Roridomyces roridus]
MDDDETSSDEPAPRRADVRRSVSLLSKIQNLDLLSQLKVRATLIRSSNPTRRVSIHGESRRNPSLNYVKQEMLDDIANERVSRASKPEGGELVTHPRSRSASKGDGEAIPVVPELLSDDPSEAAAVRPVSAATTNTASTVTPANLTPRKRPPARIPIDPVQEEPPSAPKQPHVAPKKNYHIFGIPLPSPRKSTCASRPGSPEASQVAPRRKRSTSLTHEPNIKLKFAKPKPEVGEGLVSKLFVGNGLRVTSNPDARPTPASKIPTPISPSKIPTTKNSPAPRKTTGTHFTPGVVAHVSPTTVVTESSTEKTPTKQSSRQYMSEVGNTVQESSTSAPKSSVGSRSRPSGAASAVGVRGTISTPRASVLSPRPSTSGSAASAKLTPRVRSGTVPPGHSRGLSARASSATVTTTSSVSTRERRPSTGSSTHGHHTYRAPLVGIEEDRWKGEDVEDSIAAGRVAANGNGRHVTAAAKSASAVGVGISPIMPATVAKSTVGTTSGRKHGSFDFERPGWGSLRPTASNSLGVSSRTRRDLPIRSASGSIDERRGTSAGMAGVGAARLYASTSAAQRSIRVPPPPPPPPEELKADHTGGSVSTSASQSHGTTGTNSWGRSTGKRLSAGLTKLTQGLGLGKSSRSTISGKERQHGKFAFEPPVPSLPTAMRREHSLDSARERERERERERDKLREQKERRATTTAQLVPPMGHKASHSTSSTSSTHTGVSAGHRSGTKGRSMDLGISFSWAPTKVREDAVMPDSSLGRTLSATRREQQGKEIADVFRNALDEEGYRNFKKYVHRFDAHEIPFDGPTGIVNRVERLLRKAKNLDDDERARLLDSFIKLILQNA